MTDDDFEPRLGKIRGRASPSFRNQVVRALARAGRSSLRRSGFTGARIGRGGATGRVLSDRYGAMRQRRVVIKTRIVKIGSAGVGAPKNHLRYLQRDGVARDGSRGVLYDAAGDSADAKGFVERAEGDRHQFRIIVAPEDAAEYEDLQGYTRRLMTSVEQDLGTRLDWVAVDHHNTGHPHSHVVIRGKDELGKDLIIAREYLTQGMRLRAQGIVSLDLGPRTDGEIEDRLRQEVGQERLTSLDRSLLREAGESGVVQVQETAGNAHARWRQSLRMGRLRKLEQMGLAQEERPGAFRLAADLEPTLRRMGERGDIIRALQRSFTARKLERAAAELAIHDPAARITGRVVERGLSDELHERAYVVIDGIDGRSHYAEIGHADAQAPLREGSIVTLAPGRGKGARAGVRVEVLSEAPLAELARADGATWLDRELTAEAPAAARDAGFGRELGEALRARRQWLLAQGLAEQREDRVLLRRNLLAVLRRRELARVAVALAGELRLDYAEAREGQRVEGTFRRRVDLVSGRYALVARARDFTLVPWRPELESLRGKSVTGIVQGDDVAWSRGRERGGPSL